MNADTDIQRREYLIGNDPYCQTCGAELATRTHFEVEQYGPDPVHDVHGYCDAKCRDNYDGGDAFAIREC